MNLHPPASGASRRLFAETGAAVDPIAVELVRSSLVAATEQMKIVLMRTAYNMIIYEALDFTVGLFDAAGETISIGLGLPMFMRGMSDTLKAKIRRFGCKNIEPGDVLLTNDAYATGSHLNHLTFSQPIFDGEDLVAFATCMAHWIDIGGLLNGQTTDVFEEGLQIPITKYHRRGVLNEDVHNFIKMNVRIPERAMGDLNAQLSAIAVGAKHFSDMVARYGRETVLSSIAAIKDHSEAEARAQIRLIPDGVYEAEAFADDDGVDLDRPVPIRVKVEIQDDEMIVDLSANSPQVRGNYNSGAGVACAQVAFKCLALPRDFPINDGAYRPLKVILPEGTVFSARRPAGMRVWNRYSVTLIDTIFRALAPAVPDRTIAAHHADLMTANVNGVDPRNGKFFIYLAGLIGGGWGAKSSEDGTSCTICINDGDTHNGPTEQVENKYPLLIEKYGLRPDSGGPGRHRGGLGAECVARVLAPINFNAKIERVKNPPWGLNGGESALGNQVAHLRRDGAETIFPNGKVRLRVEEGEAYVLRSGGGGGFGSPQERDPAAIEEDLRQGYVTPEGALRDYGYKGQARR